MRLRARPLSLEAGGKPIVILNKQDAEALGIHALDRVELRHRNRAMAAIADITARFAEPGEVVTNDAVTSHFDLRLGDPVSVEHGEKPESVAYIREKVAGGRLEAEKMRAIIRDMVGRRLSDPELTAFVVALEFHGMSLEETEALSRAMLETGRTLRVPGKTVVDKHSVGGIPGDKTSLLVVPLVAAAGLTIPKTSSRAITSAAGTADRFEVLAPVTLEADEILRVVRKTNGCLAWGGALDLAPADDLFIQIEYPLSIDPLLLPSILSKKKAVGARFVVLDIPTGRGAKIKTSGDAHSLARDFVALGRRLGMTVTCAVTLGEQPLGRSIGPALEAREALEALHGRGPADLVEKATRLVGLLLDTVKGRDSGAEAARRLLRSGRAEAKLREIIEAQGGDPKVRPSDIPLGRRANIRAAREGRVLWVKNAEIAAVAREAGAPRDPGAGVLLHAKTGSRVKRGGLLFSVFSNNSIRLEHALRLAADTEPVVVARGLESKMLLDKIPTPVPHRRPFILER